MDQSSILYGAITAVVCGLASVRIIHSSHIYDEHPFILVLRALGGLRVSAIAKTTALGQGYVPWSDFFLLALSALVSWLIMLCSCMLPL
jgi:hypothetical protein